RPGAARGAVAGAGLEAGALGAAQARGIEIREPPAGGVGETEQCVSIEFESRLPYQLARDGLRLQPAEVNGKLGVRWLFGYARVLSQRAGTEGLPVGEALHVEQLTIPRMRRVQGEERLQAGSLAH